MTSSTVYFVERSRHVKIGVTDDLDRRLRELTRGVSALRWMQHTPVAFLTAVPGGIAEERSFHRKFKASRINATEWFSYGQDLHEEILALRKNPHALGEPQGYVDYRLSVYREGIRNLGGRPSTHTDIAEGLRSNCGSWGEVRVVDAISIARYTATAIRCAYLKPYAPKGSFESKVESTGVGHHVVARYVGSAA